MNHKFRHSHPAELPYGSKNRQPHFKGLPYRRRIFQRLHIRLTAFCTLVCGAILALMSLACLAFSETEAHESHFADFQINVNMLISHLENQSVISHNWLSQFQADTQFQMDILDNGNKLAYERLNPLHLKESVFASARQAAREDYLILEESISRNSVLSMHAEFEFPLQEERYYASVILIPKKSGVLNIAILHPQARLYESLRLQRLQFAIANLIGILLLGIFFWIFTWRMIRPLIASQQKQAEFIASASHGLRYPLTVMLSCLSAMKHASSEEAEQFSQTIAREGKRMSRLIEDMLTLSSTDSLRITLRRQPVELDTLLLSAYEKFLPLTREKGISLEIVLPDQWVQPCPCDKERMEQVLSILLDNALSYTPPGGSIRLSLQAASDKVTLRIADNGPGIPDSEKKAIFGRFYRCDKAHEDKSHFGLGLCIAWEIIQLHKGKLWAEDTPGGGATFVVVIGV